MQLVNWSEKAKMLHQLEAKLTYIELCLLNDYSMTLALCIAKNTAVNNYWLILKCRLHSKNGTQKLVQKGKQLTVGLSRLCQDNFKHNRGWKA